MTFGSRGSSSKTSRSWEMQRARPDSATNCPGQTRLEDLLLRHDLALPPGEKDQQVDQLAPDVDRTASARDAVELGFDDPVAEPEGCR